MDVNHLVEVLAQLPVALVIVYVWREFQANSHQVNDRWRAFYHEERKNDIAALQRMTEALIRVEKQLNLLTIIVVRHDAQNPEGMTADMTDLVKQVIGGESDGSD